MARGPRQLACLASALLSGRRFHVFASDWSSTVADRLKWHRVLAITRAEGAVEVNVPAEIVAGLPAVLEFFKSSLIDGLEARTGAMIIRQLDRVLGRYFQTNSEEDQSEFAFRLNRLEAVVIGFERELNWYRDDDSETKVEEKELSEPALQDFVTGAFIAAMESPSAEKRDLFGRLIVQRLHDKTESADELYRRQAFIIARRCSERYLHILATISLVSEPPRPSEKLTRNEMYTWLDANALPLLDRVEGEPCNSDELRYLASIGALVYREANDYLSMGTQHAPEVEQMIIQETGEPFLPIPGVKVGRFYERASYLGQGEFNTESGSVQLPLDTCTLTAPGRMAALSVLDVVAEDSSSI